MKITSHLFSLSKNRDSLIAALIGFSLIQLFAKHSGIGVSPDSVTYIAATRHMLAGDGFKSFDFFPVVDFPFCLSVFSNSHFVFDPAGSGAIRGPPEWIFIWDPAVYMRRNHEWFSKTIVLVQAHFTFVHFIQPCAAGSIFHDLV